MTVSADDRAALAKLLAALGPYLDEVVLVGGWAHSLYELHAKGRSPGFDPLSTGDADIAAQARLARRGDSMAQLLERAGFEKSHFGDDTPPVTHFHLGGEEGTFYVEFLVPLTGSAHRRNGTADATATIAGVTAQKLRHVDLLITEPWIVKVTAENGFPVGHEGIEVRIANPASYLAQKLLVLTDRRPDKQAKDVLYIHDTILMFADTLSELAQLWTEIAATLQQRLRKNVVDRAATLFADVTDRARAASRIAASTARADPPSPERLVATCRVGLARVFGRPPEIG